MWALSTSATKCTLSDFHISLFLLLWWSFLKCAFKMLKPKPWSRAAPTGRWGEWYAAESNPKKLQQHPHPLRCRFSCALHNTSHAYISSKKCRGAMQIAICILYEIKTFMYINFQDSSPPLSYSHPLQFSSQTLDAVFWLFLPLRFAFRFCSSCSAEACVWNVVKP